MRVNRQFYRDATNASKGKFAEDIYTDVRFYSHRLNPNSKRYDPCEMILLHVENHEDGEMRFEMDPRECAALINQLSGALTRALKREQAGEPVTVGTSHVHRMPCPHRQEGCTKHLARNGEETEVCALSPGGESCGMLVLKGSQ